MLKTKQVIMKFFIKISKNCENCQKVDLRLQGLISRLNKRTKNQSKTKYEMGRDRNKQMCFYRSVVVCNAEQCDNIQCCRL